MFEGESLGFGLGEEPQIDTALSPTRGHPVLLPCAQWEGGLSMRPAPSLRTCTDLSPQALHEMAVAVEVQILAGSVPQSSALPRKYFQVRDQTLHSGENLGLETCQGRAPGRKGLRGDRPQVLHRNPVFAWGKDA